MARLTSELVLSLKDRVSGPARGVGRSMQQLNGTIRGAAKAQVSYLADVAGAAAILGPAAAAFAAQKTIAAAADFESALTGIQKKAGTTAAQTAALGEEIKALATSGDLAVSIDEIAAGFERGAAAGIPLSELKEFATLSAKASDAFEMSATDVGNAAAGFKTVLQIPMNEMQKYFDLINGLADSGIADESGIVNFIDRAGAMAKTFGLSAEQTAALGASLANLKVPAEVAATAVNSIFTNLLAPGSLSEKGYNSLTKLVGPVKAFGKAINKDAQGTFIKLLDKLKGMSKGARTEAIANIFGKEHLDTMLQMVEGSDEIKRNAAYAAGTDWFGSLDKSYALKLDDMNSQWQIFKNQVSELMIDVGTAGMPALKVGLEGAKALVDQIGQGVDAFKADLNMPEVDAAGSALSKLSTNLANLLKTDPSQSAILQFFREMADAVNDISAGINAIDGYINRSIERVPDAAKLTPEQRKVREEYMTRFMPNTKAAVDARPAVAAGKEGWNGPATTPATNEPTKSALGVAPSYGPQLPAVPLPRPVRAVLPTPRPNIVGPVKAEGEAAALAAEQAGQRIANAFSVTATATVKMDDAAIDASQAKAERLISTLNRVGSAAQTAAQAVGDATAAVQRQRADMDGLHADTTHPGF